MTKKDFTLIASILAKHKPVSGITVPASIALTNWQRTVKSFTGELESANSSFDSAKFLKACNY